MIVAGVRQRMDYMQRERHSGLVLDGHYGLFEASGDFGLVSPEVFRALAPSVFVLVEAAATQVQVRLATRDDMRLSIGEIEQLLNAERAHANAVSALLKVRLLRARGDVPTPNEARKVARSVCAYLSQRDK